jgi:hypothetical protein
MVPVNTMAIEDRWYAKRLPDDFVARPGDALTRISRIVRENWWQHECEALNQLIELLLPILEPLRNNDGEISDELRGQCVDVVCRWFAERQGQTTN